MATVTTHIHRRGVDRCPIMVRLHIVGGCVGATGAAATGSRPRRRYDIILAFEYIQIANHTATKRNAHKLRNGSHLHEQPLLDHVVATIYQTLRQLPCFTTSQEVAWAYLAAMVESLPERPRYLGDRGEWQEVLHGEEALEVLALYCVEPQNQIQHE